MFPEPVFISHDVQDISESASPKDVIIAIVAFARLLKFFIVNSPSFFFRPGVSHPGTSLFSFLRDSRLSISPSYPNYTARMRKYKCRRPKANTAHFAAKSGSQCSKVRKKEPPWSSSFSFTHEVDYILTGSKNGANGAQED